MKFKKTFIDYFIFGRKNSILIRKLMVKLYENHFNKHGNSFLNMPLPPQKHFIEGENYILKIHMHSLFVDFQRDDFIDIECSVSLKNRNNKILNEFFKRGLTYKYKMHIMRTAEVKNAAQKINTDNLQMKRATPNTPLGLLLGNFTFNKKELENMLESKLLQIS